MLHEVVTVVNGMLQTRSVLRNVACHERMAIIQGLYNALLQQPGWSDTTRGTKVGDAVRAFDEASTKVSASETDLRSVLSSCAYAGPCDLTSTANIWLIKAVGLSCGESILIKNTIEDVLEVVAQMKYKCVVQKYIERPLLVRDHIKFDIRQWVLLTSANPLVIYGFSEFYLRLSTQRFSLESNGLSNNMVHLTNNAIQKIAALTGSHRSDDNSNQLMMTQTQFADELWSICGERTTEAHGSDSSTRCGVGLLGGIKDQIRDITIASITAARDKIEKIGLGYEWLGLDFMVTDSLEVKLLEINTSPDTSFSTPITERLVKEATRDLMDLVLEEQLTVPSEIKKTKGTRISSSDHGSMRTSASAVWELWYFGPIETKAQLQTFSASKVDALGILDTEHKPKYVEVFNAARRGLERNFRGDALISGREGTGEDNQDEI